MAQEGRSAVGDQGPEKQQAAEIAKLKRQLIDKNDEVDIQKKGAKYFAKNLH